MVSQFTNTVRSRSYLASYFLFFSVFFQIGGVLDARVYIIYAAILLYIISVKSINLSSSYSLLFCFSTLLILFSLINAVDIKNITRIFFSLMLFFVSNSIFNSTDKLIIDRLVRFSLYVCIAFLSIELITRLENSLLSGMSIEYMLSNNFYALKVDSIFFGDSNAVAIYALVSMMFFTMYYKDNYEFRSNHIFILIIALNLFIIATLSRSAMFAMIVFYFLLLFYYLRYKTKLLLLILSLPVLVYFSIEVYVFVTEDDSGLTKLKIIAMTFEKIGTNNIYNEIFGFGEEVGSFVYSYESDLYAHGLIPLLLGITGILGTIIYALFGFVVIYRTKMKAGIVILPLFFLGLSYLPPFFEIPFFLLGYVFSSSCCCNKSQEDVLSPKRCFFREY